MKNTVIDILIYLFEHCMEEEFDFDRDAERLQRELKASGFDDEQVAKAFDWLQGLAYQHAATDDRSGGLRTSVRLYSGCEEQKIDIEGRGFLCYLEQTGILDAHSREVVIDRVMALECDEVEIEQLKWIILMVLFNQPGHEQAFHWMEDLVIDEMVGCLH